MIRKLRMKFIGICMASLVLVIAAIMGLLNFLNYQKVMGGVEDLLELLAENGGSFPPPAENGEFQEPPAAFPGFDWLSPETPYETRFFSVELDGNGEIVSVDTGKIAAVDDDTAREYAAGVMDSGKTGGFAGDYRYRKTASGEGYLIIFLDCSRELSNVKSILLTSGGVSLVGLLLVFAMIFVFSGMVMKPVYESYEKQKRFITDAGHEIKTPLTTISADMDVLGLEIGDNEWLEDMHRQTERLAGLTDELIYLARMEEGGRKIQMIDLPFSDLVEETAQAFQALAIMEHKTFCVQIPDMVILKGDEQSLRKLVSILLDNAVKYSGENGSIFLALGKNGKTAKLTVENTAQGMAAETVSHLFERFYRADSSRNSGKGGYGIRLSIAEAVVKAHRGEIKAVLLEDGRLRITVQIPIRERAKGKKR